MLKRGTPSRPHYVPLCQYSAQTKRLGLGCWEPTRVPPAVAALWAHHATALGDGVEAQWREIARGYVPPAGNVVAPFTQVRGFRLPPIDEDGDCFYSSVVTAMGTVGLALTVSELRAVVASKLTQTHLEVARVDPPPELDGHVGSLDAYRARVAAEGGAWADDFAIATVRDHLQLSAILLIDVEARTKEGKYDRVRI